jgi:serine phosphatase RsbU (regulator of sigma subunit)
VVISIGDVSGSGVVAAAAMGAARQMIRALTQTLADPVDVLNAVDRAFRVEEASPIITAFVGLLSADYERLSYASAGHPAPFVRTGDGRIEALWAPDLPIGLRDERTGSGAWTALDKGSIVVLYTDGLTEATRDPLAGEARLKAALAAPGFVGSRRKAKYVYERLLDRRPDDDVAILVIEVLRDE